MHFPLHPETPPQGVSLETLFAGRGIDVSAMHERMKSLMDAEGLPYSRRTHTYNSRLAQELGKWAETQAGGEAIHDALYQAFFVDGRNIGDIDTLIEIAESVDLPGSSAREVLETRGFEAAVTADWDRSREVGVTGVPTFFASGFAVVGAQEYATLADFLTRAGAAAR